MAVSTYWFPTEIHAGPGARQRLVERLRDNGVGRPLIVTDETLVDLMPVRDVAEGLKAAGLDVQIYDGVAGNPVISQVTRGVEHFKQAERDSVVALGGGAAMDVAKCIVLMASHPGDLLDYEDGRSDARPVDQPLPYSVALPTTAGTGSEVGRSAVVSEDDTKIKRIIFSPRLLPNLVIADPELTLELPALVTAATGMDALTHLIEAFLAKGYHPMCDGIALRGITMVSASLARCVDFARHPHAAPRDEHLEARHTMLNAALMGAVAFQKGLGVTHSCAHALSTVCDLHHGLANGILLPYTMAFNLVSEPRRFAQMAQVAGLEEVNGEGFIHWIEDLKIALGIPKHLKEVGVERLHLERLVELAMKDGCHQLNPRPVAREDFEAIFVRALG